MWNQGTTAGDSDDTRLVVEIAQLYYEQDMTQAQITRKLRIYRIIISCLFKRGRDQGTVIIAINYDYNKNLWLRQQPEQKLGLKDAAVVSGDGENGETQLATMGSHGAQLLDHLLEPGGIAGSSWGRTMSALTENLPQAGQSRQLICVPIIGGPPGKLENYYHVNTLIYSIAAKLKGESHLANFPILLDNLLTCNGIMWFQYSKIIPAHQDNLDVALVGISPLAIRDGVNWHVFYGDEKSDNPNTRQITGDIRLCFPDIHGTMVETSMSEKTLPIGMNKLKQVRYPIGIAMGEEEYSGVIGALCGKHINCLATNSSMAELLLR